MQKLPLDRQLPIELPQQTLAEFCQRWKVDELYLFGSVLREDFRPDSDVDVIVQFQTDARWGLLEFVRMKRELETLIERPVDLITKKAIEQIHNWIRRQEVLDTTRMFIWRDSTGWNS